MGDVFTMRVRAAAVAGWWTVLIGAVFASLMYAGYCWVMACRPAWVLTVWGAGWTWEEVGRVYLLAIAGFKFFLWMVVTGVVWLTLWARQLRKRSEG